MSDRPGAPQPAPASFCVILISGTSLLHQSSRSEESRVDLSSYAELAVRLVNTASLGHEGGDLLTSTDGLRLLVADREHLNHGISRADLASLRMVREEFRGFFVACSQGNGTDAADRLNELLIRYPVHPQLSGHDGQPWHVHYTESGSMSDKYAAGAAMGLAVRLADLGLERFGVCQAAPCMGVFIDTSVNRTRRYCSDRCASRANVTAYRARKRGEDL
jgi:predicted RNA-binding Zn ribbon-like protein